MAPHRNGGPSDGGPSEWRADTTKKFWKIPVTENNFPHRIHVNVISLSVCETVIKRMPTLYNVIRHCYLRIDIPVLQKPKPSDI